MPSKFLNLSTDNTLGGNSPSDNKAVSEKAIKEYVDNNAGQTYTAGMGLGLLENEFKVTQNDTVTKNFTSSGNGSLDGNYNYTGAFNSYLLLPSVIQLNTANSWEFQTTYKYNGGGSRPTIIGYYHGLDCKTPAIFYDGTAGIRLLASTNGSSWNILTNGFTPVTNTTYNIKAGFTGSEYYLEYKTIDETSWTRLSVQNSTKCYCSEKFILMNLGWNYSNYYSAGTMDLKATKIIVNDSVVWKAVTTTASEGFVAKATNSLYGLVKPDNSSITVNDGVISSHITSSDVTTALGYTPYNSSNPAGYTNNVGTVTSVNNVQPVNGNVTIETGSSRNIGEIVQSTIPLTDAGLHLLDGSLINGSGSYAEFVDYIAGLYDDDSTASYFAQPSYLNITSEGTLISSGDYSGYPVSNAFDSNISTFWGSSQMGASVNGNAYIGRSGLTSSIKKVRMYQGYSSSVSNYCTNFKFQYSNDGTTWIDIDTVTDGVNITWKEWELPNYTPSGSTHSFRVLATGGFSGGSGNNWTVCELQLYGLSTAEQTWQAEVSTYGVCGKFVYDNANNTVRLPKITGFTEGTIDPTVLGDLVQAGLPNITGNFTAFYAESPSGTGAFSMDGSFGNHKGGLSSSWSSGSLALDASNSNSIYGNSTTVQPQSIKVLYYIVIATSTKTNIQVDIDEIVTDLNGKADVDLTNVNNAGTSRGASWAMPGNTYADLTLGASGSTYTAPANGWFAIAKAGNNGEWVYIGDTVSIASVFVVGNSAGYAQGIFPAKKGQQLTISYTANGSTAFFKFIYAVGSESEA